KLICDREKEINSFVPEEYWTFDIKVKTKDNDEFSATLYRVNNEKPELNNKEAVDKIKDLIKGKELKVIDVKKAKREKKPPLPFTTSSLQQTAGKTLNFPVAKTMRIAQKLYEGVELKGKGTTSLITYLRTDSTRISEEAIEAAKQYIDHNIGHSYMSDVVLKNSQSDTKVQDAHEAIRPTYIDIHPDDVKDSIGRDEYRLYNLIWKRFIASRMTNAIYDTSKITLENNGVTFNANRSKLSFDGFMKVYKEQEEGEEEVKSSKLLDLEIGDSVTLSSIDDEQHFTLPPAHFTESNLVKTLEEDGIGRPSTYAPTIQTLLKRRYITREKKNLFATEIGLAVNDVMNKSFTDIVDEKFTANMEKR
ncbi:MAG: DNA topoisomerase, partial [Lachnospiraceae bacterium]|nr:DNA topoisomerase [Lachnospiraceae bacterium]